jgi:hypothetical protein
MRTLRRIFQLAFLILQFCLSTEANEIPFSLEDRDRIIRTEQNVIAIDKRFEAVDKRFDQLFNFLWAITGIFTAMMISMLGFAFWDRKLTLNPLKKENQRMLAVLVDYGKTQPKLLEILKNAGFL